MPSSLRISLEDFLKAGLESGKVPELIFEQVPFNHPLFIMYSSGTTGVPKCMVHSVGVGWAVFPLSPSCRREQRQGSLFVSMSCRSFIETKREPCCKPALVCKRA